MTAADNQVVPIEMPDIGNLTFAEVFKTKPIFVDFVVCEISECTGFFKEFQDYCITKIKSDGRRITESDRGSEEKEDC